MAALTPLASVSELSDYIGEPIEARSKDAKRAEWVLRTASALVRDVTGRTWLDADGEVLEDAPEQVALVTLAAASRKYTNPESLEQERDDQWYGARKVEEAGVYLTASEIQLLEALATVRNSGIGTISTTRGDYPLNGVSDDPLLPPYYP